MTTRAHKTAVKNRLEADPYLADATFDGIVKNPPRRYCTFYMDSGFREATRFMGDQTTATYRVTVHSVGQLPDEAQIVAEHVMAQLLDHTLTVPGRVCRRIRHRASQPTQMDADTDPALWYCVDVFEVTSEPA